MIQRGFVFDSNKCTGCNACQLACTLENQLDFGVSWRQVITFNPDHLPDQAVFHLSIACNHCNDPDCLKYCPTRAYYKKPDSGHVLINPDYCIGCKYCSWVCPYDVPFYDNASRVMTKCNFCDHRYNEGLDPACVTLCPTEALRTDHFSPDSRSPQISGFPASKMGPAIDIKPLRHGQILPIVTTLPFYPGLLDYYRESIKTVKQKITLRSEWTLTVFTFFAAMLVGEVTARVYSSGFFSPTIFILLLMTGLIVSLGHLGRKAITYRVVLNWRRSWLSREIILYTLFSILVFIYLFVLTEFHFFGMITAGFGFTSLYAMDRVYRILPGNQMGKWQSASVFLTAFLFASLLTGIAPVFYIVLGVKGWLFVKNHFISKPGENSRSYNFIAVVRIISGFMILPVIWSGFSFPIDLSVWILILAEVCDRILFYHNLHIITPSIQMTHDLERLSKQFAKRSI